MVLLGITAPALGNWYHIFVPDKDRGYAKPGWPTTWTYFWGKPYQGIVADTKPPQFVIMTPDGQKQPVAVTAIDLLDEASGKKKRAFRIRYTPRIPGDHYLCLISRPYLVIEKGLVYQDYVKECLHVFREDGWQRPSGLEVEIIPYTRPYGQEAPAIFRGQVLKEGKPLAGVKIQWEYYHGYYLPPEALPKDPFGYEDSPRMSPSTRADENGIFTISLGRAGWWIISAAMPAGKIDFGQQKFPLIKRAGIWIYIAPPYSPPAKKP
ncbi:DUF4198 domain-containing protein [Thermosulfuriphilus sp.]